MAKTEYEEETKAILICKGRKEKREEKKGAKEEKMRMASKNINHDGLFKEVLAIDLQGFIKVFATDLAKYIDGESIELLDKELFLDVVENEKREVDLVAKAKFQGKEACFLIHIEAESARKDQNFGERMFQYFGYLHTKYNLPIYPLVIFSFERPLKLQPHQYSIDFPGFRVLEFQYRVVQLNQLRWEDYRQYEEPIISALMAKMKMDKKDRVKVKVECLRMLAKVKVSANGTRIISAFIDTYLKLDAEEEIEMKAAMAAIAPQEKEGIMEIVTSWMEEGLIRGRLEGREEGRLEGRLEGREEGQLEGQLAGERKVVLKLLSRKLGTLPVTLLEKLSNLSLADYEKLTLDLLDFQSLEDLTQWLQTNKSQV